MPSFLVLRACVLALSTSTTRIVRAVSCVAFAVDVSPLRFCVHTRSYSCSTLSESLFLSSFLSFLSVVLSISLCYLLAQMCPASPFLSFMGPLFKTGSEKGRNEHS